MTLHYPASCLRPQGALCCTLKEDTPLTSPRSGGQTSPAVIRDLGVVIIGRNEGQRLCRCFDAVLTTVQRVVYVDSGSTDDSLEQARRRGIDVVELDMSIPFTAARARNAGFKRMVENDSAVTYVQFIDGDCELQPGWLDTGLEVIASEGRIAAVCGRLRERFREATIYNRLCDLEWDKPVGEDTAFGGNTLVLAAAFRGVGGFNDQLVAGEEPELCFRLRHDGYRILRIPAEMAFHDAAITRFSQWWLRTFRSGYACANLNTLHPGIRQKQIRSIVFWGLLLPGAVGLSVPVRGGIIGSALLVAYPALWFRILWGRHARGDTLADSALYASFCIVGKFAELAGVVKYWADRRRGRVSTLIEYK